MRYAKIDECEIVNGNGVGVSLYVQGCPIHCKGCFNPETWDFDKGEKWTPETDIAIFHLIRKPYISRFSVLGGEPLYKGNLFNLFLLISNIKEVCPSKEIWVWTGYTWEEILKRIKYAKSIWPSLDYDSWLPGIIDQIDYLIAGPFIEEEKDLTLLWRGSRNQEIIDIQQTLKNKKKVLYV